MLNLIKAIEKHNKQTTNNNKAATFATANKNAVFMRPTVRPSVALSLLHSCYKTDTNKPKTENVATVAARSKPSKKVEPPNHLETQENRCNVAAVAEKHSNIEYINGFPMPVNHYKADHLNGIYADTKWIMCQLVNSAYNREQLAEEYSKKYAHTSRREANTWLREKTKNKE